MLHLKHHPNTLKSNVFLSAFKMWVAFTAEFCPHKNGWTPWCDWNIMYAETHIHTQVHVTSTNLCTITLQNSSTENRTHQGGMLGTSSSLSKYEASPGTKMEGASEQTSSVIIFVLRSWRFCYLPSLVTTCSILRILGEVDFGGPACMCGVLGSLLSFCWTSEWVVCSKSGDWKHYTFIHTTCTQRETGNNTNARQQRVEQAEAFFQMCHINLVDPQHEAGAPPSPRQQSPKNN